MTRGSKTNGKSSGPKGLSSFIAKADAAWGSAPDWILALAAAADGGESLNKLGARMGASGGTLSSLISKTYRGRYDRYEARVRGALMSATVICPVEGEIARHRCADNQKKKPSAASPARAKFPHACNGCPHRFASSSEAVGEPKKLLANNPKEDKHA